MNHKISIEDKNTSLSQDNYFLEINKVCKLNIIVNENINSKLVIIGTSDYELQIILEKNSGLIVNSINKDNNVNINIVLKEKSTITYNHSVLAKEDSENKFNIMHQNDNSTSIINNYGINLLNKKLYFTINGEIPKSLHKVICSQNSKIINYQDGNSKIVPNLIIDSNDIVASHSAYIGKIDGNIVFYLKSRGIKKETIKKMIYKSTMLGKMDLSFEGEMFNNLINEWW